ncbi:MAG: DegT/DnrJ/EryC1/StrS family aminotransferase [Candidatus Sumerlaeia bacterium]
MVASITVYPEPRAADVFRPAGEMRGWLDGCAGLYQWGRSAIYWALRGLSLETDSVVWLPAYHCGVEIDAAAAAGLKFGFYRVGADARVDAEDLERKLEARPGPVLVAHYFGFVQPEIGRIAELCKGRGVALIEDCAHALGARQAGDYAPISIYSIYKSLPTMEGGALRVDAARLRGWTGREFVTPDPAAASMQSWGLLAKTAARRALGAKLTGAYRRARFGEEKPDIETDPVYEPEPCDFRRGMGRPARFLAGRFSREAVAAQRRRNYQLLASRIAGAKGIEPLAGQLPDGACPLVLPVRCGRAPELRAALAARSIETYVFGLWRHPAFDESEFADVARLRREVVGIPVHQSLTAGELDRIAGALNGFS